MGAMLVVLLALLLLLLGLAGMVFVYPMVRYAKERKMVSLIPGPAPRNMFLGNIPDFPARHLRPRHFLKMAQDYGHLGVVRLYLGPKPVLQVVGPQMAREIFAGSKHSTKSFIYDSLHPWLGMGLLTASGDKWKLMRRLTTPAFHFDVLRRFLDVMNEQADVLVRRAEKKATEGGGNIEVFELITACALDIICETAMGKRVNAQGEEGPNEYVEAVYEMSRCVIYRFERPWLANDVIYSLTSNGRLHNRLLSTLHGFTNRVIAERKKLLQEQGEELLQRRPAFLDILLQAQQRGEPISDENIREEVDTFMFEGHDTTSASMAWTLQLLGTHPEIQERLYQEVEEVVGESQHLTNEMLGQLKYLDMVLKESLRLYPSVPGIGRELTEDIEIGNSVISKGTSVGVSLFTLHHHPKYWDDPERFWPERWLPENSEGRDPYLYVPFSAGARNCIGQKFASNEEKVVISKFIRQFRFESLEQDPMFLPELILRPANGIHIKVFPRKGWAPSAPLGG